MSNDLEWVKDTQLLELFPKEFFIKCLEEKNLITPGGSGLVVSRLLPANGNFINGGFRLGSRHSSTLTFDYPSESIAGSNTDLQRKDDTAPMEEGAFFTFRTYMAQVLAVLCALKPYPKSTLSHHTSSSTLDTTDSSLAYSVSGHYGPLGSEESPSESGISLSGSITTLNSTATLTPPRRCLPLMRPNSMTWSNCAEVKSRVALHLPKTKRPSETELGNFASLAAKKKKKGLFISPDKMQQCLEKHFSIETDTQMMIFIILILQHLSKELLHFSYQFQGRLVAPNSSTSFTITSSTAHTLVEFEYFKLNTSTLSTNVENVVSEYFVHESYQKLLYEPSPRMTNESLQRKLNEAYQRLAQDFDQYVKEYYLRHMDILLRCFRQPLRHSFPKSADVMTIFGNLNTLYQEMRIFSTELSEVLEDMGTSAQVGMCFYDAVVEQRFFSQFDTYAITVLQGACAMRITALARNVDLQQDLSAFSKDIFKVLRKKETKRPEDFAPITIRANCKDVEQPSPFQSAVIHNFVYLTYKYLLPCLLQLPLYHFLHMTEAIEKLSRLCGNGRDREQLVLNDALSGVNPTQQSILRRILESSFSCYNTQPTPPSSVLNNNSSNMALGSGLPSSLSGAASANIGGSSLSVASTGTGLSQFQHHRNMDASTTTLQTVISDDTMSVNSYTWGTGSNTASNVGTSGNINNMSGPPRNAMFYRIWTPTVLDSQIGQQYFDSLCTRTLHSRSSDVKAELEKCRPTKKRFIREGPVKVRGDGRTFKDRYAYIFSDVLLVCKRVDRRLMGTLPVKAQSQMSCKAVVPLNAFYVADVVTLNEQTDYFNHGFCMDSTMCLSESSGGLNVTGITTAGSASAAADNCSELCTFELHYSPDLTHSKEQSVCLTFGATTAKEKSHWLSAFLALQTQTVFSTYVIENPPSEIPLRLPLVKEYRFALPDKIQYVEFAKKEADSSSDTPLAKFACLSKIIESITHHVHPDDYSLNAFLFCYRRFLTPKEFLQELIDRFNIPDPPFYQGDLQDIDEGGSERPIGDRLVNVEEAKFGGDSKARHILRKFKTSYKKKVQQRVLKVVHLWIRETEYFNVDFKDPSMQAEISAFLQYVRDCGENYVMPAVKMIETVLNKPRKSVAPVIMKFEQSIELDLPKMTSYLTSTHPLEFARQVTLYEWELYSKIEFWELSAKEKTPEDARNMLKCIDFSNRFTYWLIYLVVNLHSPEERAIVLERLIDLYKCFDVLNNVQGCQEIKGVLNSSAVYRLRHTMEFLAKRNRESHRVLEDLINIHENNDTYNEYSTQLRSKNPPCVPFSGSGDQSELIRLKIKEPDYVDPVPLPTNADGTVAEGFRDFDGTPLPTPEPRINFGKILRHYEVVRFFKSFQGQPYNFTRNEAISNFLETLDVGTLMGNPAEKGDLIEALHNRSVSVEPKNMAPTSQEVAQRPVRADPNDPGFLSEVELRLAQELSGVSLEQRTDKNHAMDFATRVRPILQTLWKKSGSTPQGLPETSTTHSRSASPSPSSPNMSVLTTSSTSIASAIDPSTPLPPTPNRRSQTLSASVPTSVPLSTGVSGGFVASTPPLASRKKQKSESLNPPPVPPTGSNVTPAPPLPPSLQSHLQHTHGKLSAGSVGSTAISTSQQNTAACKHQHSLSAPSRSPEPSSTALDLLDSMGSLPPQPPMRPPRGHSASISQSTAGPPLPPKQSQRQAAAVPTPELPVLPPRPRDPPPLPPRLPKADGQFP